MPAIRRNLHDFERSGYENAIVRRSRVCDRSSYVIDHLSTALVVAAREIVHQSVDIVSISALS
jgi:hypothetical protein